MPFSKIPCCFYPTKVLIIDDRPEFTKWMALKFQAYGQAEVYNNGLEALEALKQYQPQSFLNRLIPKEEFDFLINPEHKNIVIDLEKIQKEASFAGHSNEISVAIIDYDMPRMNGMELCKAIAHLPMKKIMLTGEADHRLAVEAFNEGLIDRFILKNTPDVIDLLDQTVFELQLMYFYEFSKTIIENQHENEPGQIIALTDKGVAAYFYDLIKKHEIKEFYLLNHFGDFLLRDRHKKSFVIGVRDQKAVEGLHHLAQDLFNQDPEDNEAVLQDVLACKRLPFFPSRFNEYHSLADWPPYMHDVHEVKGDKNTYCCAFFPVK